MKTLDKYVAREMLVPFVAGFSIIMVLLVGNIIYNNIGVIVSKLAQWPLLLYYVLLQTTSFVMLALPAGTLFGCSLAVSRLSRDSEITMMRMAGVSVRRLFLPVFVIAAVVSLASYIFQENITAWAQDESTRVVQRIWSVADAPPVQPNVFFRVDNYFFYVRSVDRTDNGMVLRKVMIYEPSATSGIPTMITAESASEENNVWYLNDGSIYKLSQGAAADLTGHFTKMKLDLRRPLTDYIAADQKTPEAMSIGELSQEMKKLAEGGIQSRMYKLEYSFKTAIPLSSLILALSVAPLAMRFGYAGGFMGVLIGIGVLFVYWNVLLFARVLGETGALPPLVAGWVHVALFSVIGITLIWRME